MEIIGCAEDARHALDHPELPDLHPASPWGGRRVHLINGVIYKVNRERFYNEDEITNYLRVRDTCFLPAHIRIPAMTDYQFNDDVVIASEYINGRPFCGPGCGGIVDHRALYEDIHAIGIDDVHFNNLLIRDGIYYLIDLDN